MKKIMNEFLITAIALTIMSASVAAQHNYFNRIRSMGTTLNSSSNESNPTLSPDGLSLYFTSNRSVPGSQGSSDIWVSHRSTLGSQWGAPQNLGPTVNTGSTESIGSL